MSGSRNHVRCLSLAVFCVHTIGPAHSQLDFERAPILYSESTPTDRVAELAQAISNDHATLTWSANHGYLPSLLSLLNIPRESQTLVFSRTSLQARRISPARPRALYFSDDVYVGWVQRGDIIEISAADPALGGTFYSLKQKLGEKLVPKRETSRCLQCHGSTHTRRIPGHIVRSVFPDRTGLPVFRLGTHLTDNRSPFEERWGGWYVSGTHGKQRHMGNQWLNDPDTNEELDVDAGANITDLSDLFDTSPYLTPHSDIVALMVLQHQVHMHNVLTAANHSGRLTERDAKIMNTALGREPGFESESTQRRYDNAALKVVKALLFCDEVKLTDRICGTSEFASLFEERGPFDRIGRSLRQFDLQTRVFRYPCSFLIYSDAFRSLSKGVKQRVKQRLQEVLSGKDQSDRFAHLSASDRQAISEILQETLEDLPL